MLIIVLTASQTDGTGRNRLISDEGNSQFRWRVQTYTSETTESPVYFFWLNPNGGGYTSHYFNITEAVPDTSTREQSSSALAQTTSTSQTPSSSSPTTSSTSSASESSTLSSTIAQTEPASASQTEVLPSPPATSAPSDDKNNNNNSDSSQTTLKVGFGVGLGVGIPLILLAGVWLGLKVVKQRRANTRSHSPSLPLTQMHDQKDGSFNQAYADGGAHQHGGLHEAYSEPQLYEISDRDRKPVELSA